MPLSERDIVNGNGGVDPNSVAAGAAGGALAGSVFAPATAGLSIAAGAAIGAGIGALNPNPVKTPAGPQENMLQNWNSIMRRDYLARYRPRENLLIKYATNSKAPLQAAQDAGGLVNAAYSDAGASQQRRLAGQGIIQTPEQMQAQQRRLTYSKGLSQVGAMNTAARRTYDRQSEILGGLR